jgi:signal transduction histidine kinase
VKNRKPLLVSTFIEEIGATAALEAHARQITLIVPADVSDSLTIDVDQQVLGAVVSNLLQNAFKFTKAHGTVTLRVVPSSDRVLIEVQDECGGLPGAREGRRLSATFEQRASDRTGLGIGLAFSRWGAEVNGGRLYARNIPGTGCVFTVDLPRSLVPAPV